jgi:cell division protease FtsH
MVVLLGGMVGEEIYMNDTTTGVSNDLQKVSQISRSMVCQYGMSDKLDKLAYGKQNQQMFLGRDLFDEKNYSEETARRIDEEINSLVHESYETAKKLLTDHRDKLDLLARRLIEKETIDVEEARVLLMLPEHKLNLHTDAPQASV